MSTRQATHLSKRLAGLLVIAFLLGLTWIGMVATGGYAWQGDTTATGSVVCDTETYEQVGSVTATYHHNNTQDAIVTVAGAGFTVGERLKNNIPVTRVALTKPGTFAGSVPVQFTVNYAPADSSSYIVATTLEFTGEGCEQPPPPPVDCPDGSQVPAGQDCPLPTHEPTCDTDPTLCPPVELAPPVVVTADPVPAVPPVADTPQLPVTGSYTDSLAILGAMLLSSGLTILIFRKGSHRKPALDWDDS